MRRPGGRFRWGGGCGGVCALLAAAAGLPADRARAEAPSAGSRPAEVVAGLRGAYYAGEGFERLLLERLAPALDIAGNFPVPAAHLQRFSARWTGSLRVGAAGEHTFFGAAKDGQRLWIDERLLIDAWGRRGSSRAHAALSLAAGPHRLRYEFFAVGDGAAVQLAWSGPGFEKRVVDEGSVSAAPWAGMERARPMLVFATVGHSNMDGLAHRPCEGPFERCWVWRGGRWVPPPRDLGPTPHVLRHLAGAFGQYEFGAVKVVVRSGSIYRDFAVGRRGYLTLVRTLRSLPGRCRLAGVVFMVGWVDARNKDRAAIARFGDDYAAMIAGVRRELGRADLPFLVSELEHGRPPIGSPLTDWQGVFDAIRALPQRVPHVYLVPSLKDRALYQDDHHYTREGNDEWSRRVVAAARQAGVVDRAARRAPAAVVVRAPADGNPGGQIARVRARLIRISRMRSPKELLPYRDALAVAEYEVAAVPAGRAPAGRIIVALRSVRDGAATEAAGFKPGQVHVLSLAAWEAQGDGIKAMSMDDDILAADRPLYVALDARPPGPDEP